MSMAEDGVDVVEVPDCFWLGGDLHMSVAEGGVDVVEEVVPDDQGCRILRCIPTSTSSPLEVQENHPALAKVERVMAQVRHRVL